MKKFTLQREPLKNYSDCQYEELKQIYFDDFNEYLEMAECSILQAVNTSYYHGSDELMDENGMEKFVAMLAGMLFMVEHDEVEDDQAYGTYHDILDFETGEYDDLFLPEDLELIRADIKTIKDYLAKHPQLLEERPRKHNNEQINRWKRRQ